MENAGSLSTSLRQIQKFTEFKLTGTGQSSDPEGQYILVGKGVL